LSLLVVHANAVGHQLALSLLVVHLTALVHQWAPSEVLQLAAPSEVPFSFLTPLEVWGLHHWHWWFPSIAKDHVSHAHAWQLWMVFVSRFWIILPQLS
jgi:hypothetical protein